MSRWSRFVSRWALDERFRGFWQFRRSAPPDEEDPAIVAVEGILDAAASRRRSEVPRRDGRLVVEHALWLCACDSLQADTPTWLIYDTPDDGIGWLRVPPGALEEVVEATYMTGGHPQPEDVLRWLRGDAPDPGVGTEFPLDRMVFEALRQKIRTHDSP